MARKVGSVGLIDLAHEASTVRNILIVFKGLALIGSRGDNETTSELMMRVLPLVTNDVLRLVMH
jgi:hypothetical protein